MIGRRLRSKWLWLGVCVVVGSLVTTIPALRSVHQAMELADSLSSGFRESLKEGGFDIYEHDRYVSVKFLFGLAQIRVTPHPYFWTAIAGISNGSILGTFVWGLFQVCIFVWRRIWGRATIKTVEPLHGL